MSEIAKCLQIDPKRLRLIGMIFWLHVEAVPAFGKSNKPPKRASALIDTGAETTSISEKLSLHLIDAERTKLKIYIPTFGVREEDALRCKINFLDGTVRILDLPIIKELEPHDVLIGRDILTDTKLTADFKKGSWSLSWA